MILGKVLTFKDAAVVNAGDNKKLNFAKETFLIYFVAVIGYFLNLLILNLLAELFLMNEMIAKMIATLIVFFWNYFARKLGIYRAPQKARTVD
jgi:putative flippase GtrA